MSFRRADGSEVNLSEFSIEQLLQSGETMRAEEVVLSVPDGRSARALVKALAHDLPPIDEIERLRTEFLSLVGYELRELLAAIKGLAVTLLEDAAALDPAETREFHRIIVEQSSHMRGLIGDLLDAGRLDSGMLSVSPEPSEMAELVERARSTFARAAEGGIASPSTSPPACPVPWPTAGTSCRCSTTCSPTTPGTPRSRPRSGSRRGVRTPMSRLP